MTSKPPAPSARLQSVQGTMKQTPLSMMHRGMLYWLASLVTFASATSGVWLYIGLAVAQGGMPIGALRVLASKLPLCAASVAVVCCYSPAALTLLTPTLALVAIFDLLLAIQQQMVVHIGVCLLCAVSTFALSIPLVAEQGIKRYRWQQAIRARGRISKS